jgi:hypothetical protein
VELPSRGALFWARACLLRACIALTGSENWRRKMIGPIELNLWPLMIFNFCMIAIVAIASYNESRARRDKHADDDAS